MKIVFIGPAGSGKGTYSAELSKKLSIPAISMGALIRDEVKNNTELGKIAGPIINQGNLVPFEVTTEILKKRLKQDDCKKGFILDGYPRKMDQVKAFEKITDINAVLNLVVTKNIVLQRLSKRRTCSECAKIYHLVSLPPKIPGICDICGGKLEQREDDTPESIKKRLKIYEEETKPLIDYYNELGIVHDINGDQSIPDAMSEIYSTLGIKV